MNKYDELAQKIDEFREAFQREVDEVIRFIKADNEVEGDK